MVVNVGGFKNCLYKVVATCSARCLDLVGVDFLYKSESKLTVTPMAAV